jgi:nitroreductase
MQSAETSAAGALVEESPAVAPTNELPQSGRMADAPVDPALLNRWSSRAFSSEPLPLETLRSLFEAARFAPSAGNLQPWLFVYAAERVLRKRVLPLLREENQRWAAHAPLLVFVFARRCHPHTGAPLRTGAFDTGAAWFALALQAERLGLNCRAMGGIHHELVHRALGVPEAEYEAMVAVAIGYPGRTDDLPPDLAERDVPSGRRRQSRFVFNGRYHPPGEPEAS